MIAPQTDHPLRAALSQEMHARRFPPLRAPARVLQQVLLADETEATAGITALRAALDERGTLLQAADRHLAYEVEGVDLTWEWHSEFVVLTLSAADPSSALFCREPFASVVALSSLLPGRRLRATHVRIISREPSDEEIAASFAASDLVISEVEDGAAQIWCDFRLHAEHAGRLLVQDRGLVGAEASQLVQRLQDLGNYRKMALLGLPLVRASTPDLTRLERRLAALTIEIAREDSADSALLKDLSALSGELAQLGEATGYRLSATLAYAQICADRLRRMRLERVRGFISFDDFTERRLLPATRTCEAFARRLDDLRRRAESASALLRTRVETALGERNEKLLASMDRRTELQLRLQHTVEGLSVVAVSYYAIGIWHYFRTAAGAQLSNVPSWLDVAIIPIILIATWFGVRSLRRNAGG